MVRIQKVESFYAKLRESAISLSSHNQILIFHSTSDVDSICALKVITHIFESDSIQYSCFLVSSFLEIHKYAGPGLCSSSESHVTILLINLGCDFDVLKLANESFQLHLERGEDYLSDGVGLLQAQVNSLISMILFALDPSGKARTNLFLGSFPKDGEDKDEKEEEEEDEDDDGDGERPSKRRQMGDGVKVFKKLKRDYYKMETFHGKASVYLLFELSHMLRKNTNELLWLACVFFIDQFVHERLSDERYQAAVMISIAQGT